MPNTGFETHIRVLIHEIISHVIYTPPQPLYVDAKSVGAARSSGARIVLARILENICYSSRTNFRMCQQGPEGNSRNTADAKNHLPSWSPLAINCENSEG